MSTIPKIFINHSQGASTSMSNGWRKSVSKTATVVFHNVFQCAQHGTITRRRSSRPETVDTHVMSNTGSYLTETSNIRSLMGKEMFHIKSLVPNGPSRCCRKKRMCSGLGPEKHKPYTSLHCVVTEHVMLTLNTMAQLDSSVFVCKKIT